MMGDKRDYHFGYLTEAVNEFLLAYGGDSVQ